MSRSSSRRKDRRPLGSIDGNMFVEYVDGKEFLKVYVTRFINDVPGRLQRAESGGWEPVKQEEVVGGGQMRKDGQPESPDSGVWRIANRHTDGGPVWAKLMKIRKDWYDEDQRAKEERNLQVDRAIRDGTAGGADIENKYGEVRSGSTKGSERIERNL